jgi:hypothetical protein
MPEWKLGQDWGWIEEAGELTVAGALQAGVEVRPGILGE